MSQEIENPVSTKKVIMLKVVILTVIGSVCGWVGGSAMLFFLSPQGIKEIKFLVSLFKSSVFEYPNEEKKTFPVTINANNIVQLAPIISNLADSKKNFIRLDIVLIFKDKPDLSLIENLHQDIMAYIRTVSVQDLEVTRGLQYLRDDIEERVNLRSKGGVSKVIFRTFIIE
ncbi:flagellar protein [Liberibacter crescens BT-1]|uniref:Flagellar protein FliL n=1 Tax=Liberibacter crescens (strain BT-1) TaxID=1215343 RepID=L0ERS4_LIBCB|nr:flagellar basal body-associated FliL family protein [Liberibacter crescens]AGA64199.1 flagellar protein [Liberibacter crescens BT-1]AMC12453.1 hypothetical protein RL73_01205 [Liberibacter crescens]